MTGFDKALAVVLAWEGGFSDHPADPGGATKYGITRKTLSKWRRRRVSKSEIRTLTRHEAEEIYRDWYWDKIRGDDLPEPVAIAVFDAAVNQGPRRAIKFLQRALGIRADGIVGPVTIGAASKADPADVLREFMAFRALAYSATLHRAVFGRGWFRRLFDVHRRALEVVYTTGTEETGHV